jgi:hypothetical protein
MAKLVDPAFLKEIPQAVMENTTFLKHTFTMWMKRAFLPSKNPTTV